MELGGYYRDDPETAKKSVYYFDDPKPKLSGRAGSPWLTNLMALLLFVVGGTFIQFTYAANVNLSSTPTKEFGQGILTTGACSGSSSITITPLTTFVNASGAGAYKVSGLRVAGVPLACQGVKFSISAYGETATTPVALYNTNATVVEINDYSDGTFGVDLSAGLSITTHSANSFTVNFTNPVALASATYKYTMQSEKNETLGVQWTPFTIPNYSEVISTGTFGNGRYVFGGTGNQISLLTSTNGTSWTVTEVPELGTAFTGSAFGNGKYVLVSDNGDLLTTNDGVTYTIASHYGTSFFSVAHGNGKFVAVGTANWVGEPLIYTSTDGLNWVATSYNSNFFAIWSSVIYTAGSFYVIGPGDSEILTSGDGVNWVSNSTNLPTHDWSSIAATSGIFATSAMNTSGNQYRSTNATTWSKSSLSGRTEMLLAASSGVFVGVGRESTNLFVNPWIIYSSKDAQQWSERSRINGANTVALFYANKEFYAVSDTGAMLVSR
jgi:hypothetical protein